MATLPEKKRATADRAMSSRPQQLSPNSKRSKSSKSAGRSSSKNAASKRSAGTSASTFGDESDQELAYNGLQIIEPNWNDIESIKVLEALDAFLSNRMHLEARFKKWSTNESVSGIRTIQGGRYEIFVEAGTKTSRKPTEAFRLLVEELLQQQQKHATDQDHRETIKDAFWAGKDVDFVKRVLIRYASEQAQRDPRIKQHDYKFDNFSFLINYGAVEQQHPHIDLLLPNVQCGCLLTDQSKGTISYDVPTPITSAADIKKHVWKSMSRSLEAALESNQETNRMVQQFGSILHPKRQVQTPRGGRQDARYPRGTVFTLPGGVIHAGPKTDRYRCILFFSGALPGRMEEGYNPDAQYFAPLLVADLLAILFQSISVADRRFLIEQLSLAARGCKTLHRHLADEAMVKFTRALITGQYGLGGKEELIQTFAEGRGIVAKGSVLLPSGGPVAVIPSANIADVNLKLVSSENLHTMWEGKSFAIHVFRVTNDSNPNRVRIQYLADDTWEGGADVVYSLEIQGTRHTRFDGTNGTLRDDEGNVIKCYAPPP